MASCRAFSTFFLEPLVRLPVTSNRLLTVFMSKGLFGAAGLPRPAPLRSHLALPTMAAAGLPAGRRARVTRNRDPTVQV